MSARTTGVVAGALLWVFAPAALATSKEDELAARDYNQAAIDAFKAQDFEKALENFENAFRKDPNPKVRLNLAVTNERLDRLDDAQGQYEAFLRENPSSEKIGDIKFRLNTLQKKMKTWGRVVLTVDPAPDDVTLGPHKVNKMPATVWLEPGTYTMSARKEGFLELQESVVVVAGGQVELQRSLVAVAPVKTVTATADPPEGAKKKAAPETSSKARSKGLPPVLVWGVRAGGGLGMGVAAGAVVFALFAATASGAIFIAWRTVPGLDVLRIPINVAYYGGYTIAGLTFFLSLLLLGASAAILLGSVFLR